ncbi:PAS domain-containing protein [Vibrio sp. PP-XX7]
MDPDYLLLSLEQSVDSLSSSVGNRQQLTQDQVSLLNRASPSLIYQMRVIQPVFNENTSDQPISEKSIDEQQILKQQIDILAVSPGIEIVIGYAPEDIICIPGWWINQIHPQDIVNSINICVLVSTGNTTSVFACEYRVKNRQGIISG